MIRDAQVLHQKATGQFTDDGKALLSFIDTARTPITKVKMLVDEASESKKPQAVIDTIGYNPVKESFSDRNYINMLENPFSEKEKI